MSPRGALRVAAIATVGCTTSFDLASLPLRDVPAADVPAPLMDAAATDLPTPRDLAGVTDLPAPPDAPRCGGAGEPCCARDARADLCDPGLACDATQRCARCADTEALCDGRCVDVASDVRHCGACGVACPAQNICRGGGCAPAACAAGFANCDAPTGCATDLRRDANHCGGCGVSCARPNAIVACNAGRCELQGCRAAFADCDGDPANGCETRLLDDPENCGGCRRACPAAAAFDHVRRACVAGVCQRRCDANWYDCDGDARDCEIRVNDPLCAACSDPRCRAASPPPDGRERRCCNFVPGSVSCCTQ